MASKLVQGAIAAVVVAGAAAAGWWATHRAPDMPSSAEIGAEEAAFAFSECKARLLDGSPAIAVMFTQALDRRQDFSALLTAAEGTPGTKADADDPSQQSQARRPGELQAAGRPLGAGRQPARALPALRHAGTRLPHHDERRPGLALGQQASRRPDLRGQQRSHAAELLLREQGPGTARRPERRPARRQHQHARGGCAVPAREAGIPACLPGPGGGPARPGKQRGRQYRGRSTTTRASTATADMATTSAA